MMDTAIARCLARRPTQRAPAVGALRHTPGRGRRGTSGRSSWLYGSRSHRESSPVAGPVVGPAFGIDRQAPGAGAALLLGVGEGASMGGTEAPVVLDLAPAGLGEQPVIPQPPGTEWVDEEAHR